LGDIYFFFLGRGIPNSRLSISKQELKRFLSCISFLRGYSLFHGDGSWDGIDEETSLLLVTGITEEQAIDIIEKYKDEYSQEAVWFIKGSVNNQFI
jgi:hypothetical protein